MSEYRFLTQLEFQAIGRWDYANNCPIGWNHDGRMNKYIGQNIPPEYTDRCHSGLTLTLKDSYWTFQPQDYKRSVYILDIETFIPHTPSISLEEPKETKEKYTYSSMKSIKL